MVVEIGMWYTYCCAEDLTQITTQEQIDAIKKDLLDPECEIFPYVFSTKEEALEII